MTTPSRSTPTVTSGAWLAPSSTAWILFCSRRACVPCSRLRRGRLGCGGATRGFFGGLLLAAQRQGQEGLELLAHHAWVVTSLDSQDALDSQSAAGDLLLVALLQPLADGKPEHVGGEDAVQRRDKRGGDALA